MDGVQVTRSVFHRAIAAVLLLIAAAAAAPSASAQAVGVGTIQGRTTDETGAALPGVSVTISSPALQLRQMTAVTDGAGEYRFPDIPIGLYSIKYELTGFQSLVRDGVRLTASFVARIDVVLKLGSVEETITVSGQTPVVDVSTTAGITTFTKEVLETAPTTRAFAEVLAMSPGFRAPSVDVGGSELSNQRVAVKTYGTSGQITPQLEGINTRQGTNSAGFFYDYSALEEAEVKAVGNEAEVALPGGAWNAIVKSGGNAFHGRYFGAGQHSSLQSDNVDDDLRAQGVTVGSSMRYYRDFSGDLGGRLVRDRLWFYGALHDQRNAYNVIGFSAAPGPDNSYGTADDVPAYDRTIVTNQTAKGTYQASRSYKVIGFFQRNEKIQPNGQEAGRFTPLPATYNYKFPTRAAKGELAATPTSRFMYDVMFARQWYDANRFPQDGEARPGNPQTFDRETQLNLGPQPTQLRPRSRWQSTGTINYYPESFLGGHHQFKSGYQFYWENVGTAWPSMPSGDYRLIFDRVSGLSHQPVEIEAYNNPILSPVNRETQYAAFVQDKWTVGRFTVNLGLRAEQYHTFVDEQVKEQGTFGTGGRFPAVDVLKWQSVAPRVGTAWDLRGDGKSVVKATYGWFNHVMSEDFAQNYNQNARTTYRYRWHDLNGNKDYDPGEVNLDLNGPDFISVAGATNNILNPDLQQPVTHEVSLGFERELMTNFSARALYVYKRQNNLYASVNVLRPFSAYTIPINRRDPGPDGVLNTADDGGVVHLFDYDAAYRGSAFVGQKFLNTPDDRDDNYQTIELSMNKRMTAKWDLAVTYSSTKNHRWITSGNASTAIPDNPNATFFPVDSTRDWYFKLVGSYKLPWNVYTSAYLQSLSGTSQQRTYVFRATDPDGGTPLRQLATITVPLEEFGGHRLPVQNVVNWRASKRIKLGPSREVEFDVDLFNALNVNTVTSRSVVSGPTFGAINSIVPPRVIRLGGSFSF